MGENFTFPFLCLFPFPMILERQVQTPLQIKQQKSSSFLTVSPHARSLHKILNLHLHVPSVADITPGNTQNTAPTRHS